MTGRPRPTVLISGRGPYTTTCTGCEARHTTGSIAAARAWRAHHTATCTGRSASR